MSESPGTLIGLSNVATRARARVAPGPALDGNAALRDRLKTQAMRALEGRESYIHDAILHGARIRLFTNSHHLGDFWRENFWSEGDWKAMTGLPVSREPALTVHAAINVAAEPEASYTALARREVFLFNTSYYADLRACALEALGRLAEGRAHVIHGGAVEIQGRGLALLYPKELIHPTPVWGLMEQPAARFIADGWFLAQPDGTIHALEKAVYFRTSLIESYPEYAPRILLSKFENVPDATPALLDQKAAAIQKIQEAAGAKDPRFTLRGLPPERTREFLARLVSSPDSRAMVDAATLFGKGRLSAVTAAAAAFALRAGPGEPKQAATVDPFPCPGYEVHVGAVPGHPREVARLIGAA